MALGGWGAGGAAAQLLQGAASPPSGGWQLIGLFVLL